MPAVIKEAQAMIAALDPQLLSGTFVFCSTTDDALIQRALPSAQAMFVEAEGTSLVLSREIAESLGFEARQPMRQISLNVFSALDGVGLTAAVASALAAANIACNVVAAMHHDHVFVPADTAEEAMAVLVALQRDAATERPAGC